MRSVVKDNLCKKAMGVDGSKKMIDKANKLDPSGSYVCADLISWLPKKKVDIVHSMEVFYYLINPKKMIQQIFDSWLKKNGRLIIGIDFFSKTILFEILYRSINISSGFSLMIIELYFH